MDNALFLKVIATTPLASIDLIVRNPQAEVLPGKRLNRPAQDFWFVPGGRILSKVPVSGFHPLEQGAGTQPRIIGDVPIHIRPIPQTWKEGIS